MPSVSEIKNFFKKLDITLEEFNMKLEFGTKNVITTSFSIAIISSLIGIILANTIKKYDSQKYKYKIIPIYDDKNVIELHFNSNIKIKIFSILNAVIYGNKRHNTRKHINFLKNKEYKLNYG